MTKEKVSAIKFEDILCFRSKHNVLVEPLNDEELLDVASKSSRIKVKVRLDLHELIETEGMDDFNSLIDDKILNADATMLLSDVSYKIVGVKDGDAIVRVEATLEDFE